MKKIYLLFSIFILVGCQKDQDGLEVQPTIQEDYKIPVQEQRIIQRMKRIFVIISMIQRFYQQQTLTVMNNIKILLFLLIILNIQFIFSENNNNSLDTIIIMFNDKFEEFEKIKYVNASFSIGKEKQINSYEYTVEQMEEDTWSDTKFRFSHHVQSQKTYKKFGGAPPLILKKPKLYLDGKKVLDIEFFRTTPYGEVTKTFEEEDSWEQDVMIFMVDVDEMKNDSIVLREVDFSRPVKQ